METYADDRNGHRYAVQLLLTPQSPAALYKCTVRLTFTISVFGSQNTRMSYLRISEQTRIISFYNLGICFWNRDGVFSLRGANWIFK